MPSSDSLERIVELEMAVAHLQHELEQMHTVLLSIQSDLKSSRETISRLERRIQTVTEPPEERDLSLERPPHY